VKATKKRGWPETPPDWDLKMMGERFAVRRKFFGWSIDELAKRAKVSRHTVMRVEAGQSCRYSSIRKLRSVLQYFSEQLTRNPQESKNFALSRGSKNRWLVGNPADSKGRPVFRSDFLYVDDAEERRRQAGLGYQKFFTSILRSELPDGVLGQGLMEIYSQSPIDRHFGEEFIYCLEGVLKMMVAGEDVVLEEGDSIVFDATKPHRYSPGESSDGKMIPAKILIVVGMRPDEAERIRNLDLPVKNWGV
jgi:quercetin dioxygenase-like cupin family protein/DNA-binding XRE family transcriptional regulator